MRQQINDAKNKCSAVAMLPEIIIAVNKKDSN
jgi:hypothetical protein